MIHCIEEGCQLLPEIPILIYSIAREKLQQCDESMILNEIILDEMTNYGYDGQKTFTEPN